MDDIEDTGEQAEIRHKAGHLSPWQFKPGKSGNPSGRKPNSRSMKEFARDYLSNLTDKERIEFFRGMNKLDIWKMAEGGPDQKSALTGLNDKPLFSEEDMRKADKALDQILNRRSNQKRKNGTIHETIK